MPDLGAQLHMASQEGGAIRNFALRAEPVAVRSGAVGPEVHSPGLSGELEPRGEQVRARRPRCDLHPRASEVPLPRLRV